MGGREILLLLALASAVAACGGDAADEDGGAVDAGFGAPDAAIDPSPLGFIGSPCESEADCEYDGAVCLTDGFPGGTCSLPCDRLCPDRGGHPTTFCADTNAQELPPSTGDLGAGACLSRCDFGIFPDGGCRPGYGCIRIPRASEPDTLVYVCVPGAESELDACREELAARGVAFEPAVIADEHPDTNPELTCHIQDPVYVLSPVFGVELADSGGTETPRVLSACNMAHALADTVEDVAERGVVAIEHYGTYNCRVIAGTSTLSRHGYGDAIDIAGLRFGDGTRYTIEGDWEIDNDAPETPGGLFLYEAAHRWFDALIWNIILTPNYNAAHYNHFHVDLTPGSHFLGFTDGRYIGPAPYAD